MIFAVALDNRTPFAAATHVQLDADGQEVFVLMISASFVDARGDGRLEPAPEQVPVAPADVFFGAPGRSSTRYEADIAPVKPGAEVLVNGSAHAPGRRAVTEMQVGLKIGPVAKVLQVTGDRIYNGGAFSAPQPFRTMPIVYERAYGGTGADGGADPRNPVGIGHSGARSADPAVMSEAPNVTYPGEVYRTPSDRPRPAGFGAVGRGWQPRIPLAGTYDDAWLASQWPLPPVDFDARHYLAAPADQRLPRLLHGEPVTLVGLTPEGRWTFRLPEVAAPLRLVHDDRIEEVAVVPDTLLIEPDLRSVTLKARLSQVHRREGVALREVVFGHVSPVLVSAKRQRKGYLSTRGGDGTLADLPVWRP